ncbi:DNA-directed RNA polymerase II subunit RPB2 [Tanacetum coccineum]
MSFGVATLKAVVHASDKTSGDASTIVQLFEILAQQLGIEYLGSYLMQLYKSFIHVENLGIYLMSLTITIHKISFGQIYLSKPMMTETDGETATLFAKVARLRNLTYSVPLYVDVTKSAIKKGHDCEEVTETQDFGKVFIRKVPIMLRSSYCRLFQNSEKDLTGLGECLYDQGGYFIINESEKVLIAQENMSTNHVYVFKKRQPNKYAYVGEVRSMAESQNRPPSTMLVRMLVRTSAKGGSSTHML